MPVSVLRERGSSACLKSNSFDIAPSPERKNKVTIINTNELPNYSTERYYMLSEIQLKAHSITFLRDIFRADDDTQELSASSSGSGSAAFNENEHIDSEVHVPQSTADADADADATDSNTHGHQNNSDSVESSNSNVLPPFIILYLLWSGDSSQASSPQSYVENVIKPAVDQIMDLHQESSSLPPSSQSVTVENGRQHDAKPTRKPPIYLVVDRLINPLPRDDKKNEEELKQEQIALTEELARHVATCQEAQLRSLIEGVTVGLSDNFRAAPGLEACMDAILVGDAERRHFPRKRRQDLSVEIIRNNIDMIEADPGRSCIGLVTEYPDDLTGIDPSGETDAVQGLALHARSVGNWAGNGNILNFAARSQKMWREKWDFARVVENKALSFDFWTIRSGSDLDSVGNSYSILGRRRQKKRARNNGMGGGGNSNPTTITKYLPSKRISEDVDHSANMMIIGFLSFVVTMIFRQYPDEISQIASILTDKLAEIMGLVQRWKS